MRSERGELLPAYQQPEDHLNGDRGRGRFGL